MKIKLLLVSIMMSISMAACSERDSSEKTNKIPENTNKVEIIQEKDVFNNKINDMKDVFKMSLQTAYKTDDKLNILQPDVLIDSTGKNITLVLSVNDFINQFGVNEEVGKNFFNSQMKVEDWVWIKNKAFDYYGKEAKMSSANEITIIIMNRNDNKEIKRF